MNFEKRYTFLFWYVLLLSCFLFTKNTFAYIDPQIGSYLVQLVAGFLLTSGAFITIFWNKIKNLFTNKHKKTDEDSLEVDTNKSKLD